MPAGSIGFFNPHTNTYIAPDISVTKSSTPRVHLAKFGDGYEQRIAKGINNKDEKFNVSFENRTILEINNIVKYFDDVLGVTCFEFTLPAESSGTVKTCKVVCETYNRTYSYNNFNSLNATFRRVYEPVVAANPANGGGGSPGY